MVECHLAKVDVDGSNPFARSIFGRHSQVAKAAVCKTVILRFESGCRLQKNQGVSPWRLTPFLLSCMQINVFVAYVTKDFDVSQKFVVVNQINDRNFRG